MLTLNDGRSELWQWDTGRKLSVDADCSQVHFSNKVFGRSIDVDVVDGVATIPDILLQTDKELTAWAFVGTPENGYTKISKVFKVNKRNKPADYVFTAPDQTTLGDILDRIEDLEKRPSGDVSEEDIQNAVNDYLDKNPVSFKETDPTVPAWAKQPNKPTYTAAEVGAMPADAVLPSGGGGSVWLQPFELMGTATLQEDCTRWIITQTDDGTTFDNKRYRAVKFITKMIPSADTSASNAKANVWLNDSNGGKNLIGENMYHSSGTRTQRFYGECSNDASYLKQLGYAAEQLREGINKFPYVKQIVIDPSASGHKFGAGSTVEIWGCK